MQNQTQILNGLVDLQDRRIQQQRSSTSQEHTQRELQERIGKAMNFVIDTVIPVFTLYTPDFSSKFGNHIDVVAREYASRLVRHNITMKQALRGLERFKLKAKGKDKWSINPEEFVDLCRTQPEDLGIPPLEQAIREIVEARSPSRYGAIEPYEFSHRVVELMNKRIGYDVQLLSANEFKRKAAGEYEYWVKIAMKGKLPEPRAAITHQHEEEKPEHLKGPAKLDLSFDFARRLKEKYDANGTPYIVTNPGPHS